MVFLFLLWYASMQSASVTYCSSFEFVRCLVCSCNNLSACRFLSRRLLLCFPFFFFNDTATTEIYTLSLHDALPFSRDYQHRGLARHARARDHRRRQLSVVGGAGRGRRPPGAAACQRFGGGAAIHDRQRRRSGGVSLPGARLRRAAVHGGRVMNQRGGDGFILEGVRRLGAVSVFLVRLLLECVPALGRPRLLVHQIYNAGARSLIIIMLSGLFVGMVLGLQAFNLLQRFGSEEALGTAAALGLLKELSPVITALLFAGRAGTALTSEIGLMRATDQLTAMEIMADRKSTRLNSSHSQISYA